MNEKKFVNYGPALMLSLIYTISIMDRHVISILLEPIKHDLTLSDFELALMSGLAFAFFYGFMGIPIARLADRKNRVTIISICLAVWSLMTTLSGLAVNFTMLILARMGVGVGEAGCAPCAHSIIVDTYKAEVRSKVMAIYNVAQPFGAATSLFLGGWMADTYGWRMTLVILGIPGILVAIVAKLFLKEPPRTVAQNEDGKEIPSITQTISLLIRNRLFRATCLGHVFCVSFTHTIAAIWLPTYIHRQFGVSLTDIGLWLGGIATISGIFGTLTSGVISDRLYRINARWLAFFPGLTVSLSIPIFIIMMTTQNLMLFFICTTCVVILINAHVPPCFSLIHHSVDASIRAMTIAMVIFTVNLIGFGVAPVVVGLISDLMQTEFGRESLRIGLFCAGIFLPIGAVFFLLAGRTITTDENGDIKLPEMTK